MAELRSQTTHQVEMYLKNGSIKNYFDLIVKDDDRNIYLLNIIGNQIKTQTFIEILQEKNRQGQVSCDKTVGDRDRYYVNSFNERASYNHYSYKVEDLLQTLIVSKSAFPEQRQRQEWEAEERRRVLNQEELYRRAPEELILSWDGNVDREIFHVLYERYNTPMDPEWSSYIVSQLKDKGYYTPLQCYSYGKKYDLEAGLLSISELQLEEIITEGVQSLSIVHGIMEDGHAEEESKLANCRNLDDYLNTFANDLGEVIQQNSEIRFDPMKEKHSSAFYTLNLHANKKGITGAHLPQADAIMGAVKTLHDSKYVFVIGEMGVGKTRIGTTIPYVTEAHKKNKEKADPYRALVFAPTTTIENWEKEILNSVPDAHVYHIRSYKDIIPLKSQNKKPDKIEYYIISSDVAKASHPLEPIENWKYAKNDALAAIQRGEKFKLAIQLTEVQRNYRTVLRGSSGFSTFYCPQCNTPLKETSSRYASRTFFQRKNKNTKSGFSYFMNEDNMTCKSMVQSKTLPKHLRKKNATTQICGYRFWGAPKLKETSEERKVSPAWFINKHLPRGFFKYLIADEVHQYKSGSSHRAKAFGQLVNHTEKQILLTGTLVGGMAQDIFYLIARLDSKKLKKENISYEDKNLFIERYGVYEHIVKTTGEKITKNKKERAGISPQVFTRFLISNSVFLELSDLANILPAYNESPVFVDMDPDHMHYYREMESALGRIIEDRRYTSNQHRVITSYVTNMYQYCDMPFDQQPIVSIDNFGNENILYQPHSFDSSEFTPRKFYKLQEIVDENIEKNRKVLVYATFTGKVATDVYIYEKLKSMGYKVGIMKSSKSYDGIKFPPRHKREEWLREQIELNDWDVVVMNPTLVSVGLNLTMFPTIVYYQMDYSTYNYLQSSRRSWRITQTKDVEIYTLVYRDTIQCDVLSTIARKIDAALSLQGKFSEEGLRAMAETQDGLNALAKRIVNEGRLDSVDSIESRWKKINETRGLSKKIDYEGYEGYTEEIMNPLGLQNLASIRKEYLQSISIDVTSDKNASKEKVDFNEEEVNDYLEMVYQNFDISKADKKNKIQDGQLSFNF
jgi:SNF2 family DNA or RNA helicase